MAVYALVSAKGSPGVTTTMVALTRAWHAATGRHALGVDLDPHGGDVAAGALRGAVLPGTGVLAVATNRNEDALTSVLASSIPAADNGSHLLPGVPDGARSGAIPLAWDVVSAALTELDAGAVDVVIDGGRLDAAAHDPAWMSDVDLAVLVVRPSLPWVCAAHRVVATWPPGVALQLLVIDSPSPYSTREVARAVGRPVLGVLPFDPRAASVHSDGAPPERNHGRGAYARAVGRLAAALSDQPGLSGGDTVGAPEAVSGSAQEPEPETAARAAARRFGFGGRA